MTDLDERLRSLAQRWLDGEATTVDVVADRAAVLARADGVTPIAARERAVSRLPVALAAAAAVAVIAAGVAIVASRRDADSVELVPPTSEVATETSTSVLVVPPVTTVEPTNATTTDVVAIDESTSIDTPAPTSAPPVAVTPDVGPPAYVIRRDLAGPNERGLWFELHDIAPDGTDLGLSSVDALDLGLFPVDLGDGMAIGLSDNEAIGPYDGRCRALILGARWQADAAVRELPDIPPARWIVGNATVVVAARDVCPAGTRWGDAGTYSEIVRYDPAGLAEPVQLMRLEADPSLILFSDDAVVVTRDEPIVDSISPDGRFMTIGQGWEQFRWTVYRADQPGPAVELGSECPSPGNLVGRPSFPSSEVVVVARECGPGEGAEFGRLIVEAVSLDTLEPIWSRRVDSVPINYYSQTISSLSATFVGGELWVIVSGWEFEGPSSAVLLHSDDPEIDISRQGDDASFAFTAAELVRPSDVNVT